MDSVVGEIGEEWLAFEGAWDIKHFRECDAVLSGQTLLSFESVFLQQMSICENGCLALNFGAKRRERKETH